MDNLRDNLSAVQKHIAAAARKSGRKPEDICLIGVSKTVEPERARELLELGVKDLGENRVQELLRKTPLLADMNPSWHLIGHLQTNKVKYIIDKVAMIHSLDSLKLAREIDARAAANRRVMDVLIEINIAGEGSKFGVAPGEAADFAAGLVDFRRIRLRGLMCVAPFTENPEENRDFFEKMRNLLVDIRGQNNNNRYMDSLSMGMTNDYAVAIEEGATMVRIGTGLWGERSRVAEG